MVYLVPGKIETQAFFFEELVSSRLKKYPGRPKKHGRSMPVFSVPY
jgi:hypothetical protein